MRGMRRFTLVPSLSVATSSDTGTGLSETAYFGFAICPLYTWLATGARSFVSAFLYDAMHNLRGETVVLATQHRQRPFAFNLLGDLADRVHD